MQLISSARQRGQARIKWVGVEAGAHWDGEARFKIHHSIAFEHQFITGSPPLREILHPPLAMHNAHGGSVRAVVSLFHSC